MNQKLSERDTQREQNNREELAERIARGVTQNGRIQPIKGLYLTRFSAPTEAVHGTAEPSFCVIAQGGKEVYLGNDLYRYDPYSYLLATLELPVVSRIVDASERRPFLGLRLNLDPALVGAVMVEMAQFGPRGMGDPKAICVSGLDTSLLDAVLRLVRLLESPDETRLLFPLVAREIMYRLLSGEQGDRLRQMTMGSGQAAQISKAVETICRAFHQPLRVEEIARQIGMSVSGFHHHFKAVTAMSPLQFQKHLRLREARRLLLTEHLDAATAGFRVGYEDASYFSRDYKRLFGVPPMRDVERLREAAIVSGDV